MHTTTVEEFRNSFPIHGSVDDQIRHLLQAATRAPSTHNSQPWRFHIEESTLTVYRDSTIVLPNSDEKMRYAHISIGFLLHHIETLSAWLGMNPQGALALEGMRIATFNFTRTAEMPTEITPLVRAFFTRRNRRGIFSSKQITVTTIDAALAGTHSFLPPPHVRVLSDRKRICDIARLTRVAMLRVYRRPKFRREMSRWITPTGSPRTDGIPGYSLNQPLLISWILPTLIRFVNIGKIPAKVTYEAIASAPTAFGFGAEESPSGWLGVGYAASHMACTLVSKGFDYSVFVASIECPDTRAQAEETFGLQSPLQFIFVAGTLEGTVDWMTPRTLLDAKLV